MDVVHPSSDMKKPEPSRPSRQGITIAPRPTFEEAPQPDNSSDNTPKEASDAPVTSEPTPVPDMHEHPDAKSEWPDPLDMAGYEHEDTAEKTTKSSSSPTEGFPVSTDEPDESDTLSSKPLDAPLTSPFLPDAKVEKRPLGGAEPTAPAEEPDHTPVLADTTEKTQNDPNDQLPALPKDVEPVLPEELHTDLVEVESDTNPSGIPKTEVSQPISALPPEPPKEERQMMLSGPTSIPQQYHEEPTSGDKHNGAIYDTDTYHKPLAHPAKKKSGWLWVVWIVIILLVGAGAGAALYFLGVI